MFPIMFKKDHFHLVLMIRDVFLERKKVYMVILEYMLKNVTFLACFSHILNTPFT